MPNATVPQQQFYYPAQTMGQQYVFTQNPGAGYHQHQNVFQQVPQMQAAYPGQAIGQPPMMSLVMPQNVSMPPNTLLTTTLPHQLMYSQQVSQQSAPQPPAPRVRKAIPIVDPKSLCEVDIDGSAKRDPELGQVSLVTLTQAATSKSEVIFYVFTSKLSLANLINFEA
jgi:hypothetical protein